MHERRAELRGRPGQVCHRRRVEQLRFRRLRLCAVDVVVRCAVDDELRFSGSQFRLDALRVGNVEVLKVPAHNLPQRVSREDAHHFLAEHSLCTGDDDLVHS